MRYVFPHGMPRPDELPNGECDATIIPLDSLSRETVRNIVAEYVSREATDLTDAVVRIEEIMRRLRAGEAAIGFDAEAMSTIVIATNGDGWYDEPALHEPQTVFDP